MTAGPPRPHAAAGLVRIGCLMAGLFLLTPCLHAGASDGDPALAAFARPEAPRLRAGMQNQPPLKPVDDSLSLAPRRQPLGCPWVAAARLGRDAELRAAVRRAADLDCLAEDGFTPLAAAAFAGQRSTVRLLLKAGANPRRQTASGQTALHLAALVGQVEIIDELLRHRTDVETLNAARESALDVAAQAGQGDTLDRLLQAGADSARAGRR